MEKEKLQKFKEVVSDPKTTNEDLGSFEGDSEILAYALGLTYQLMNSPSVNKVVRGHNYLEKWRHTQPKWDKLFDMLEGLFKQVNGNLYLDATNTINKLFAFVTIQGIEFKNDIKLTEEEERMVQLGLVDRVKWKNEKA